MQVIKYGIKKLSPAWGVTNRPIKERKKKMAAILTARMSTSMSQWLSLANNTAGKLYERAVSIGQKGNSWQIWAIQDNKKKHSHMCCIFFKICFSSHGYPIFIERKHSYHGYRILTLPPYWILGALRTRPWTSVIWLLILMPNVCRKGSPLKLAFRTWCQKWVITESEVSLWNYRLWAAFLGWGMFGPSQKPHRLCGI